MKIAVLFDGAGLARLGLEQAGHECTGFELDPSKHYLSKFVGSGNCVLQDATTVDLEPFDAIWASPPCQFWSSNNITGNVSEFGGYNLLDWSLDLVKKYPNKIIWVENVFSRRRLNTWGLHFNAAQFTETPLQQRKRIVGGIYKSPKVYRNFKHSYKGVCPAILAGEYKTPQTTIDKWLLDKNKIVFSCAAKFLKRPLTIFDGAYYQGFEIPDKWLENIKEICGKKYTEKQWINNLYEAIGNGVPVYMAKAFGEVYE